MNRNGISVILPVYNARPYIKEALESVMNQTLPATEVIVVDDASTDGSDVILKSYAEQYPQIQYVRLPDKKAQERRTARALNTALSRVTQDFVAWMDADDIMLPNRLELQLQYLQLHPFVIACGTQAKWFGNGLMSVPSQRLPLTDATLKLYTLRQSPFLQSSVMMRNERIIQHELRYDESFAYAEDYDFFSRVARLGKIANLPDVLLRYRMHPTQSIRNEAFVGCVKNTAIRNAQDWFQFSKEDAESLWILMNHRSCASINELKHIRLKMPEWESFAQQVGLFEKHEIQNFFDYAWNKKCESALLFHPGLWRYYIAVPELFRSFNTLQKIGLFSKGVLRLLLGLNRSYT